MKIYIIDKKVSYNRNSDGILSWHADNFHGKWVNKVLLNRGIGDAVVDSLRLEKNAYDCRWIFQPERNFVIPSKLCDLLVKFENIKFLKVEFSKVFLYHFEKNDFSFPGDTSVQLERWLDSVPHDERLREQIGEFYELIPGRYKVVIEGRSDLSEVSFGSVTGFGSVSKLLLSRPMLAEYPIFWSPEGMVMREDFFDICEPFFSWDYFLKNKVEI